MPTQKFTGAVMASFCVFLLMFNPVSRFLDHKDILIWQDSFIAVFAIIFSLSVFFENVFFKLFHILCFFVAGSMTFLFNEKNSLAQYTGLLIVYTTPALMFSYGFFAKKAVVKLIGTGLLLWLLIYISTMNVADSGEWAALMTVFSTLWYAIHKKEIEKGRKWDAKEKLEMEQKMMHDIQVQKERAEQAEEDALTMLSKVERLEKHGH